MLKESQQYQDFVKAKKWMFEVLPFYEEAFADRGHVVSIRVKGELKDLGELQELCKKPNVGTAREDMLIGLTLVIEFKDRWTGVAPGWSRTFTFLTAFVSNWKKPNLRFRYDRPSMLLPGEKRPKPDYHFREDFMYGKGLCINLSSVPRMGEFDRALVTVVDRKLLEKVSIKWDDSKSSRHRFRLEPAQRILESCSAHIKNPKELVEQAEENVERFLQGVDEQAATRRAS